MRSSTPNLALVLLFSASVCPGSGQTLSAEERRVLIRRLVLQHAERRLERIVREKADSSEQSHTEESYLMLDSSGRPSYAEGTLECVAALLMADQHTQLATKMIDIVLGAQATRGHCPGGFPWTPGGEVSAYATAYLAPWLAYIHQHLAERLPEPTRSRLANALRPALGAVQRFSPQLDDSRAYLVKVAAEATLSAALGDSLGRTRAATEFLAWLRYAREQGLATLHQPAAHCVVASALHWIFTSSPSPECHEGAAAALEYLYRDLALRYQPNAEMVAGAVIAGHYGDFALGTGPTRYLLHAQFGRPDLHSAEPFALFLAVPGFTPREDTIELTRMMDAPRIVQSRILDCTTSTYVHPRYALGTMTGQMGPETKPVVLTYGSPGEPSAYCEVTPQPARVTALQSENRALVCFDIDNVGYEDDRLLVHADFHFGLRRDLDAILVNQARWTTDFDVAVESRGNVVTERDGVYTAVIPIAMGPAAAKPYDHPVGPAELSWRPLAGDAERELVLTMAARSVRAREKPRHNYRIAFAVEMASNEDYPSVEAFAEVIGNQRRVTQQITTRRVKVGEKTEDVRRPNLYDRPVERGNWIYEARIVQGVTLSGEGFSMELLDDLEQNRLVGQRINGAELVWDFIYRSPMLNHLPGEPLHAVLRPLLSTPPSIP